MIALERGVLEFVKEEAKRSGIKKPIVLIMDCGCMMNEETVELDIKEEGAEKGYNFYMEVEGIKFLVNPKVKRLADRGRIGIMTYGEGRFKRLEYYPSKKKAAEV
jgi:hypothetical protein